MIIMHSFWNSPLVRSRNQEMFAFEARKTRKRIVVEVKYVRLNNKIPNNEPAYHEV